MINKKALQEQVDRLKFENDLLKSENGRRIKENQSLQAQLTIERNKNIDKKFFRPEAQ